MTGAEIKQAAGIPLDFKLYGPRGEEIATDQRIEAHPQEKFTPKLNLDAFAIVIDKTEARAKFAGARAASDIAWEYLLQRRERRTTKEKTEVLLIRGRRDRCTETDAEGATRGRRRQRVWDRAAHRPFKRLLDDPVPRSSAQSYFLRLAPLGKPGANDRVPWRVPR